MSIPPDENNLKGAQKSCPDFPLLLKIRATEYTKQLYNTYEKIQHLAYSNKLAGSVRVAPFEIPKSSTIPALISKTKRVGIFGRKIVRLLV